VSGDGEGEGDAGGKGAEDRKGERGERGGGFRYEEGMRKGGREAKG